MVKTLSIIGLVVLLALTKNGFSQQGNDTILMLNGTVVIGTVIDTVGGITTLKNPKDSTKNDIIENDRIFSISNQKGESIIYVYDTIIGNEFTIEEMRYFIKGEQDAEKGYKARGAFWGNMAVGAASGATFGIIGVIPVFAFIPLSGLPKVKIKASSVSNPEYLKQESYIMGYERVARKKRKIGSMIGGGIGFVAGMVTFEILKANDNEIIK